MKTEKILAYLGFAAASRTAVTGTDLVLDEIRRAKKDVCVVVADDVSQRTEKQLADKCAYYKVPLIHLPCSMEEMGRRTGKGHPVAAAAVVNPSLAQEIQKCSEENSI